LSPTTHSIQEAIEQAQNILVITHMSPDGDAVGSLTAVGVALTHWGKQVVLMCDDPVPGRFYYLPMAAKVQRPNRTSPVVDLVIAVDCGDEQRMGQSFANLPQPRPFTINIDHHVTNSRFGQINLVGETAVSTTEILFDLFMEWGLPLDAGLAASLLTGLVTDTLGFRTVGTNAKTLKIASTLVEAGADLPLITAQGLNLKQFSTMRLWRYGLDGMKLENGLIWTTITNKQRKAAGFLGASSNGLSNLLADVDEAAIGVVIMEMGDSTIRVGWRCRPPYNVAEIAQKLGGGGHSLAAGCTIIGPLDEVEEQVVMISKEAIRKQRGD
jgi:phosphoesterase RecJ-like protein